ncbi:hypothetical protein BP6252_09996 [Coleophoma cylindrospora]|uniref:Heterokaryon incompatibility domain-containing protein n=1 Tax=Coleophoma cylindrospora TaxID=1849047 RepID=A0A3D8QXE4_9HELO|nr:hypothetical protein BP6252_09996 [Coleophoma cylindrospora]
MHERMRILYQSYSSRINSEQPNRLLKELITNEVRSFLIICDFVMIILTPVLLVCLETLNPTDKDEKLKVQMRMAWTWTVSISVLAVVTWIFRILLGGNKQVTLWYSGLSTVRLLLSLLFVLFPVYNVAFRHTVIWGAAGALLGGAICNMLAAIVSIIGFRLFDLLAKYTGLEIFDVLSQYNEGEDKYSYSFNWAIGEKLVYLTNDQRLVLQNLAIDQIKGDWGTIRRDTFWYSPMHHLEAEKPEGVEEGQRLLRDTGEAIEETQDAGNKAGIKGAKRTLFSPCYCCLDSDFPRTLKEKTPKDKEEKIPLPAKRRKQFLAKRPQSHIGPVEEVLDYQPHILCTKCEDLCNESAAINFGSQFIIWKKGRKGRIWRFEHWPTAEDLKTSAEQGCHLCTLIWCTLNSEQQAELLQIDSQLDAELQVRLAEETRDISNERKLKSKIAEIRFMYHRKRCIVIVVESNGLSSHTSVEELESDLHTFDDWFRNFTPRLVPHFGDSRIAQRWLPQRTASRAISMGVDPATEWHREQAGAIRLSPVFGRHIGMKISAPIVLPVSTSTGSDLTMKFIKSILSAHDHCHGHASFSRSNVSLGQSIGSAVELLSMESPSSNPQSLVLPTRLIDVGTSESTKVHIRTSVSIREQKDNALYGNDSRTEYLALSHCWGKSEILVLTDKNQNRLFQGFPISDLAQTFQDAISVTRRLGYQYLWIDSLCIVQKSKEDWEREAPTMKDVYSNAACVIAAIAPWDCTESLFAEQNPLAASPCLVSVAGGNQKFFNGIYAFPPSRYNDDAWDNDIRFSRLRSRAWCFQEEYLAKRIIYFGQYQVYVSCKSPDDRLKDFVVSQTGAHPWNPENGLVHASKKETPAEKVGLMKALARARHGSKEDYVDALLVWGIGVLKRFPSSFNVRAGSLKEPDPPGYLLKDGWWKTVREYSSRYLTHEGDRIAALAGIAPFVQTLEPDAVYIFGLWGGEHLTMGLLWYVSHGRQKMSTNPRIPSWSWISTGGTIDNNSTSGSAITSKVVIRSLERDNSGPKEGNGEAFGMAYSVKIKISGVLKKGKWGAYKNQRYYRGHKRPPEETITESHLFYYTPVVKDPLSGPEVLKLLDTTGKRVGWIVPDTLEKMPEEIFCLRIVVEPEADRMKEDFGIPWATRGLVLQPAQIAGEYKRIVYFELNKTYGSFTWPGVWSGQLSSRGVVLPIRRPGPDIDVAGFFNGCIDEEICII